MQTRLSPEVSEIINKIPFLPAVTIVMPYNPKMTPDRQLNELLERVEREVKAHVFAQYNDDLAMLVLDRLSKILLNLHKPTLRQSVALFVSPVFQKVLYLNYPVDLHISVDENFSVQQAILSNKNRIEYLLINLENGAPTMYFGNEAGLFVIKTSVSKVTNSVIDIRKIDKDLEILINAYKVPVFVVGSNSQLKYFQNNSSITKYVARYVTETRTMCLQALFSTISVYFNNWGSIKQQMLITEIQVARANDQLACGLRAAIDASKKTKPLKLIVDKDFLKNYNSIKSEWSRATGEKYYNRYSYVKSNLDELIEQIIEEGGSVEITDMNGLSTAHHICLIYKK